MRFGLFVPPFGPFADVRVLAELAASAERFGWNGFFLWDHILGPEHVPVADPWVALSAVACATERLHLGPLVTPLARRRPWVVARQAVTLDHLSGGRLVLGVGLGGDAWKEFSAFGETVDDQNRARTLDEALEIITALWSGTPVTHDGPAFHLTGVRLLPTPRQAPRIPIWVGGIWPNRAPLRRAARHDGVFPIGGAGALTAPEVKEMMAYIRRHRAPTVPFDVVLRGRYGPHWRPESQAELRAVEAEGVSWWLEAVDHREPVGAVEELVAAGPPRLTG